MLSKRYALPGVVVAVLFCASTCLADDPAISVRKLFSKSVEPDGPGAAVMLLRNGKPIYHGEFGFADVDNRLPIKPETNFDLASCSKQFTAMAVMILAERGKLSFDDDVRKFLPELDAHDPAIRIRHLLTMTSGLKDYTEIMDDLGSKTNLDVLHTLAHKRPTFAAGAKWDYSNTNYALLALIVERASKQPFAQFMQENIFTPAGMKQTVILENASQSVKHRAQGYAHKKGSYRAARDDTAIYGDGQVMSNTTDLAAWDRALTENKLVKPELLKQAFTPAKLSNGKPCEYGFGWNVTTEDGHHYVWHDGAWTGTSTYISRDLNDGLTVIVLSNIEEFDADKTGDAVAEIFRKAGE